MSEIVWESWHSCGVFSMASDHTQSRPSFDAVTSEVRSGMVRLQWICPDKTAHSAFKHFFFDSHSAHSARVFARRLEALGISACVWLGFWPASSFFPSLFCFGLAFFASPVDWAFLARSAGPSAGHVFFLLALPFFSLFVHPACCIGRCCSEKNKNAACHLRHSSMQQASENWGSSGKHSFPMALSKHSKIF